MSETAKDLARQLFDGLKGMKEAALTIAPGLRDLVPEMQSEMSRLGKQGASELASALFNGNGFVIYGPGQHTQTPEPEQEKQQVQEQNRAGMER
jgi:hypothetical protein